MNARIKNNIVKHILGLRDSINITGTVGVKSYADDTVIDINYDNRKYIGRVRLLWCDDRFIVYMMDKAEGKIESSKLKNSKSAYLLIKSTADAKKFVKWYELTTQLAALARTRA